MCVSRGMALEETTQSLVQCKCTILFLFITWACLEMHLSFNVLMVEN